MLLQMTDVSKQFGGVKALNGISFSVDEKEILGIIGPNGAGKTTIFNLITGVFPVSSGDIRLEGETLLGRRPHQITERGISRTFQNIRLFGQMTVLENIMVGAHCRMQSGFLASLFHTGKQKAEEKETVERARELLRFVGLGGLEEELAENLPYGKQRRLEIARALAASPKLLLLDEPAAGMNDSETEDLRRLISRIRDEMGTSVIIIEHDMNLMMNLCNRMVVLNFGSKLAEGEPEEIRSNSAVIEAYLGKESA